MSSHETEDETDISTEGRTEAHQAGDSMASKLSKELSNWRRRRTSGRPSRDDGSAPTSFQAEPARTIKVRGHETLVIRKAKVAKPAPSPERSNP